MSERPQKPRVPLGEPHCKPCAEKRRQRREQEERLRKRLPKD